MGRSQLPRDGQFFVRPLDEASNLKLVTFLQPDPENIDEGKKRIALTRDNLTYTLRSSRRPQLVGAHFQIWHKSIGGEAKLLHTVLCQRPTGKCKKRKGRVLAQR